MSFTWNRKTTSDSTDKKVHIANKWDRESNRRVFAIDWFELCQAITIFPEKRTNGFNNR